MTKNSAGNAADSTAKAVTARAYRIEDGSWTIEIPELTSQTPSGVTITATGSTTTFRGIQKAAARLAAAWLDVAASNIEVAVTIEAPTAIAALIEQSHTATVEADAAIARADALRRQTIRALRAEGYSLEAAGAVLGITYQRVQQLEK